MTEGDKIDQLRALSDAGAFKRRVTGRVGRDLYSDNATLECGHIAEVPRGYEEWECRECRKAFEPAPHRSPGFFKALIRPKTKSDYSFSAVCAFFVLYLVWLLVIAIPQWGREHDERERDYQELKQRVTRLEQRMEEKK